MDQQEGQATEQPDLNEAQAAEQIAGLFKRERQPETPEETQEVTTADDNPEPQDDNTITIDPEAPLFDVTIKAEGGVNESKKVSLKELESGYMMQADYQRKTAELARAREQLTSEVQKMVEPERQQYVQNLQMLQQAVLGLATPDLQQVNWEQLAAEDPAKYVQLTAKAQKVQQMLQHIQAQQSQAQQQALSQAAEHSKRMLQDPVEGIQGWGKEMYESLSSAAMTYGYSPEEMAQVVDYRAFKVLKDAAEYRKLQSAKPTVEKKVTAVPKVLKPGAPAGANALQAKNEKELTQRLRQNGDVKDAAALLLAQMRRKR